MALGIALGESTTPHATPQKPPRTPSAGGLRIRSFSGCGLFGLTRSSSVPSFEDLEAYKEENSVTAITPEFARAYLQARKLLRSGALKFPVVRSATDGSIVDCGNVYQWKKGVAARVVAGELVCSVVTFVRNRQYDPADPDSALFTEHTIQGRAATPTAGGASSGAERGAGGAGALGGGAGDLALVAAESSAQGVRRTMEDETVILMDMNKALEEDPLARGLDGPVSYFGVFDGHGGKRAAHYSAKHMHFNIGRSAGWHRSSAVRGSLRESLRPESAAPNEADLVEGISEGFLETDRGFLEKARKGRLTSGTTACVIIVQDRTMYVANLGDSRAVLCRKRKAVPLSSDQNTTDQAEQKRVVKDGGYIASDGEELRVGGVLCVTRAVGDYDPDDRRKLRGISAEPVVERHALDDDDEFVILACDGLWDVFSAQSAVDFARQLLAREHHPAVACEGLVAEALKRGSTDNVSVLLVRLGSKPIAAAKQPGMKPRSQAMAEQKAVDATLPEDELRAKAAELKRQGKYIPMHLKRYLK